MSGGYFRTPLRATAVRGALAAVASLLCWSASPCSGHPAYITVAHAIVQPDGSCRVTLEFDTLAFALNDTSARIGNEPMETLLNAPRDDIERALRDARGRFEHGFAIVTEQGPVTHLTLRFPKPDDLIHWRETARPVLPALIPVEVEARLPAGTGTVAFQFPGLLAEVILTVERPGEDFFTEPVEGGKVSSTLPLHLERLTPPASVPRPTSGGETSGPPITK